MKFSLLLLSVLFFQILSAQEIAKDVYLKHTILQEGQTYQFSVLEINDKHVVTFDRHKLYFWYKAQKVIITQGGASGQLLHGPFVSFYDNKQLVAKGNFVYGLKDGEWMYWSSTGYLTKVEHWKEGVKSGKEQIYNELGKIIETISYTTKGTERQTSDSLIVSTYSGDKKTITVFDEKGEEIGTYKYKNGELVSKKERKIETPSAEKPKQEKDKKEVQKTEVNKTEKKEKKTWFSFLKRTKKEGKKTNTNQTVNTNKTTKRSWKFWKKEVKP
jgi:hypothetical protein